MKILLVRYSLMMLSLIIIINSDAQKPPNKQEKSIRAPTNIKIDGAPTEWHDQCQAYNKATDIFYTISNDDSNVYLVTKATKSDIINKIMLGGITFLIDPSDKNRPNNSISITFPIPDRKNTPLITLNKKSLTKDTNEMVADSVVVTTNHRLMDFEKMIAVGGINSIHDSLISVYNEYGIKAISLFDNYKALTYELAIPLKYIKLAEGYYQQFKYNIKLNGAQTNHANIQLSGNGRFFLVTGNGAPYAIPAVPQTMTLAYATDFWGQYTLAKIP